MKDKFHFIRKQIFEVDCNSLENGLAFRLEFTDLVKRSLLPLIEEVLNELSSLDKILRIEKIDLHLDSIDYPFDDNSLREKLRKKLKDELNLKIVSIFHKKNTFPEECILTIARTEEELLLYFLQEGTVPWWVSESNTFSISMQEIIDRMITHRPTQLWKLLTKIIIHSEQVRRFLSHVDESSFYLFLSLQVKASVMTIENTRTFFLNEGIANILDRFLFIFKEFTFCFYIIQKKEANSKDELSISFTQYLLENHYVREQELSKLFPENYLILWVRKKNDVYTPLLKEYIRKAKEYSTDKNKKDIYIALYRAFIKNSSMGNAPFPEVVADNISGYFPELAEVIRQVPSHLMVIPESSKTTEVNFDWIERVVLYYLQYGLLSWEYRTAGVRELETIIQTLHEKYPERLNDLFIKIKKTEYPIVLKRLETDFSQSVRELLLTHYFDKSVALEEMSSIKYRENIVSIFFEKATLPWSDLINHSVKTVEEIIHSFYQSNPAHFVRRLKEQSNHIAFFRKRVGEIFSPEFNIWIGSFVQEKKENEEEENYIALPTDADSIVYFLVYFEKYQKLPTEANFTIGELVEVLIDNFPVEGKLYFTLAEYAGYKILKQRFHAKVQEQINKWIFPKLVFESKEGKMNYKKTFEKESKQHLIKDPVYISNAGLVLIHPFLQRFFSLCGLLEKRNFKSQEARSKAALLLQYMVSKEEKNEEHRLVLNKVLCGIPLSESIDRTLELTIEEKETCESLIRGVIENWPILNKTSSNNFRVSLLQREGRLTQEEANWKLKVEERSYDILLDKLPWSISMIKLPWMERMLQVEWR